MFAIRYHMFINLNENQHACLWYLNLSPLATERPNSGVAPIKNLRVIPAFEFNDGQIIFLHFHHRLHTQCLHRLQFSRTLVNVYEEFKSDISLWGSQQHVEV